MRTHHRHRHQPAHVTFGRCIDQKIALLQRHAILARGQVSVLQRLQRAIGPDINGFGDIRIHYRPGGTYRRQAPRIDQCLAVERASERGAEIQITQAAELGIVAHAHSVIEYAFHRRIHHGQLDGTAGGQLRLVRSQHLGAGHDFQGVGATAIACNTGTQHHVVANSGRGLANQLGVDQRRTAVEYAAGRSHHRRTIKCTFEQVVGRDRQILSGKQLGTGRNIGVDRAVDGVVDNGTTGTGDGRIGRIGAAAVAAFMGGRHGDGIGQDAGRAARVAAHRGINRRFSVGRGHARRARNQAAAASKRAGQIGVVAICPHRQLAHHLRRGCRNACRGPTNIVADGGGGPSI